MTKRLSLLAGLLLTAALPAAEPSSYAKQVRPFFARYCVECHNAKEEKGGLNLETYAGLLAGGDHGAVLTPGKGEKSRIVRMVEGISKPAMPPKKAKQPQPGESAVLRAWIDAGARDDGAAAAKVTLPPIQPRTLAPAPVAALAYRPDGKLLAAGGRNDVFLIDPAEGEEIGTLPGQRGQVTALAFSPDGGKLAVASGVAGNSGEVRVYAAIPGSPPFTIPAHRDLIYGLAFSPDGKTLATCGYDRLVRLWDAGDGKEIRTLKDHSDAVYGVAFSPDGKLLATGAADRSVKVWDAATGARLHTLGESTDWVYAVAWSPDGRNIAAAGVDKSIRVWELTPQGVRLRHSVFAHEGPVARLAYSADGKSLYSLGEDRFVKAWDAGRMVERIVYPRQPEAPLALAVRHDGKQLAVGRFDGVVTLLDAATGKVQSEPLPAKPKPPVLTRIVPDAAPRGAPVRVRLVGKHLAGLVSVTAAIPHGKATVLTGGSPNETEAELLIPPSTPPGVYPLTITGPGGKSTEVPFTVDAFRGVGEASTPHTSPRTGQAVALPATLLGTVGRAGEVDWYRFEVIAGQEVGVQVMKGPGSKLEPTLTLTDADGRTLAESESGLLGYRCPAAGTYALGIRDRDYRGEASMTYRLHTGDLPVVTGVFPLGLQRGTEADIRVEGVNLGQAPTVRVRAPADAAPGTRLPVSLTTPQGAPLGNPSVVVGEFPEATDGDPIPVPGTANGRVEVGGPGKAWQFSAKKGQRLLLEVNARRLGSPLDSTLEILDAAGKPLPRATLRCVSKTVVVFRDHDSTVTGIRIEAWADLAVNDYLLLGGELLRINALPKNPDDDCQFFGESGQRLGYLGTTPTYHSMGEPLYKVAIHPPGSSFPPNGLPAVTLYYRNDDGGPGFGKDSFLTFDPPADGDYQVRVGDAGHRGGPLFAYRLTVCPPRPDFTVSFSPGAPAVARGAARAVSVTARRIDGFDGPIAVHLENLPPGFRAPATTIPAGENSTSFALSASPDAAVTAATLPLKLVARAEIGGKEVVREATGGTPRVEDAGDLVTTTGQDTVTLRPGGQTQLTVKIERRNGHTGRVPLEVRGLPHGVRVLDIGLNGILITERETTRTIVIYAEPWIAPTEHPFVVLSRSERKGTEHAAHSVLLRVVPKD
jgi:DNA-binding beta-propeller fold protein YncE